MNVYRWIALLSLPLLAALLVPSTFAPACAPVALNGHFVVNADQTAFPPL